MSTVEELKLEVERWKEAFRKKEKENEDLIDRVRVLSEGMREMERRMEERMEEKISSRVDELMASRVDDLLNQRFAKVIEEKGQQQKVTSTPRVVDKIETTPRVIDKIEDVKKNGGQGVNGVVDLDVKKDET